MDREVRLRLDLGYDGTEFSGWARQPARRTVQGELEGALGRVLRADPAPSLTVAGRTDAGVHARGQVAHVDVAVETLAAFEAERHRRRRRAPVREDLHEAVGQTRGEAIGVAPEAVEQALSPEAVGQAREALEGTRVGAIGAGREESPEAVTQEPGRTFAEGWQPEGDEWLSAILRRLSGVLPPDVRVHAVSVAPAGFDARFSALSRRYAYRVCDAPGGVDPLRRREVLWHNRPLDVDSLNAASARLVGEHDFAAFCRKREGATTIRELQRLDWVRGDDGVIVAAVVADAFCHSMVRALVGSLLAVGEGRRPVEWPAHVLANAVRDSGVHVAPAHGLTLEEVRYPDGEAELVRRAGLTRRVRTLNS